MVKSWPKTELGFLGDRAGMGHLRYSSVMVLLHNVLGGANRISGDANRTVTVLGSNFASDSLVRFGNAEPVPGTVTSSGLQAVVPSLTSAQFQRPHCACALPSPRFLGRSSISKRNSASRFSIALDAACC